MASVAVTAVSGEIILVLLGIWIRRYQARKADRRFIQVRRPRDVGEKG